MTKNKNTAQPDSSVLPTCDDSLIWESWMSSFHYPVLEIAMEYGLFEELNNESADTNTLSEKLDWSHRVTNAICRLLTTQRLIHKHDNTYYLSQTAKTYLLKESPFCWEGMINFQTDSEMRQLLRYAIEREKPGSKTEDSRLNAQWEAGTMDAETAVRFTKAMNSHSMAPAACLANSLQLKKNAYLLDIGGGSACYSKALLSKYPEMNATVLELEEVCKVIKADAQNQKFDGRLKTYAANMFTNPWPEADIHLLSNVLHDWDMKSCRHLIQKSFDNLKKGGKILIHEMLLNDSADSPAVAAAFSVKMLLSMKGKQFTFEEIKKLLQDAGFKQIKLQMTFGYYSVTEATKA